MAAGRAGGIRLEHIESFEGLVSAAAGHDPYEYQCRIARDGLPDLLKAPTGAGKTLAATLPWLWRRRFHPDEAVRSSTPHWLVFVLPMRVLVEQTAGAIRSWVDRLGLTDEVGVHVVMGGEGRIDSAWRLLPEREAIFVGTLDMLLSRALNRGYGESRFAWPIDFGLFHNGCQWVFDEIQLMGPGLPTSRQLEGLRRKLGTASSCASMWMSATVDEAALATVDLPEVGSDFALTEDDRAGALGRRLTATKRVEQLRVEPKRYSKEIAAALVERHEAGTLTLAVLNTVDRARDLHASVLGSTGAEVVLLHSRFRPIDRRDRVREALAPIDPAGPGRIVVSTQVVEAGVDISATLLCTEVAPWPSIVQRAGRCNRDGQASGATLFWVDPPHPEPYEKDDVRATADALTGLEGRETTSPELGALDVTVRSAVHPVLRRRDLVGLFDTTPDLSGNDLDVSRFIRDGDDIDVLVAWRSVDAGGPASSEVESASPTRDELCAVPIGAVRDALIRRAAWRFDHLDGAWVPVRRNDLRAGMMLVMRAQDGGYTPETGWEPKSPVQVTTVTPDEPVAIAETCEAIDADPATFARGQWVALREHLADTEAEARALLDALHLDGLAPGHLDAAVTAARLHDIGKVHPVFQDTLMRTCSDDAESLRAEQGQPWAKSGGSVRARHARRYFRHELASALALLDEGRVCLGELEEPDLAVYLVAAHHGRVRLGIRSLPNEARHDTIDAGRVALGIFDGETLPAVDVPGVRVPESVLDLSVMELGDAPDGRLSWGRRALALRDRTDLGVFRLAFLEALVRLADWRASRSPGGAQ
ncbi:MAG: type I-G CRISPR-associated helicase/endonuclease Cas3g [Actinomycetota bacterium]